MNKQIAEAVTEYKERGKRKFNLIFHNVKESAKTDSVARRIEDIEEVVQIGKELGCEPDVKEAIQLGKRVDGRTRLLRIVVEEFKDRRMLLGWGGSNIFFKVRVSICTCVPNLGAVRHERLLTIDNPLNPPGVGWVKKKNFNVRVSIRTCVPNLGAVRRE